MNIRGGSLERGRQMSVGATYMAIFTSFVRYYLPKLHIHGHNYYIVLCSPLVALHWRRNGWPWMNLNGYFALKSGPSSAFNGLAFWLSEKTIRKFAELYAYNCPRNNKKVQQSWQNSALAMHLPLARLVSTCVIFCLLPSSSIVILVFYLFSTLQTSVNSMCENCECE